MDASDISAISVIGGLGILGSLYAYFVIPRKGCIFYLIVSLFVVALMQTASQYFRKLYMPGEAYWWIANIVNGLCYCYLFYLTNWLYVIRLFTLGHLVMYEKATKYMPAAILVLAFINFTVYTVYVTTGTITKDVYIGLSSTTLAFALACEVYLVVVLIRKIVMVFSDHAQIVSKWIVVKTKVYLGFIIFLEFLIFVLRVFVSDPRSPEGSLRAFGFVVRTLVIIDFFRDLIKCLLQTDQRYVTPIYSI